MNSDRTSSWKSVLLLTAMVATIAGCNKPAHQLDTAPVAGRVTLDGEPVTSGYIYTSPRKGRLATAKIASDGTFKLGTYSKADGASIGEHAVMLAPIPADEGPTPEGAIVPPARYASARSSGISITVPAEGLADYLIELQSSPKDRQAGNSRPQPIE